MQEEFYPCDKCDTMADVHSLTSEDFNLLCPVCIAASHQADAATSPSEALGSATMRGMELRRALKDADKMAMEIDRLIQIGKLDARSKLGDLRLNYGQPHEYAWSR